MAEGIVRFQNVALGYDGVPVLEASRLMLTGAIFLLSWGRTDAARVRS